ncbi:MAG: hypothetical protein ACHQW9_03775 [Nitrososphaerales archaeon]
MVSRLCDKTAFKTDELLKILAAALTRFCLLVFSHLIAALSA